MSRPIAADPVGAQDAARRILSRREFRPERPPKPIEGPLRWISDRLNGIADWIGQAITDTFNWIFHLLPGVWGLALGIALCVGLAAFVVWLVGRNRQGLRRVVTRRSTPPARVEDPDELDRRADAATQAGEYGVAIRFRYRAGLIRLDRAAVIELRPWNTSSTLTRRLASPRFDRLTDTFDAVAYGGQAATNADASTARSEWPTLLAELHDR